MFRGAQAGNVDPKGRLKVSSLVRRRLKEEYASGEVFITSLDGKAVRIFPIREWAAVETILADRSAAGNQAADGAAKNKILFQANRYGAENTLDNQGRFLVPAVLRDSAGMRGEVKIQWQSNHMFVLSAANYEVEAAANELSTDELSRAADYGF